MRVRLRKLVCGCIPGAVMCDEADLRWRLLQDAILMTSLPATPYDPDASKAYIDAKLADFVSHFSEANDFVTQK